MGEDHSGEEDDESVPVCSMARDPSVDDICADAAVAPMQAQTAKRDVSPSSVCTYFLVVFEK